VKWEPIARVKLVVDAPHRHNGRSRVPGATFVIHLGPGRQLRCGCKRTWTLLPEEIDLPENADTCIHIRLLYGNGIVRNSLYAIRKDVPGARGHVYLTDRGKQLFAWRFVATALK
jgi:hypothetical protein